MSLYSMNTGYGELKGTVWYLSYYMSAISRVQSVMCRV